MAGDYLPNIYSQNYWAGNSSTTNNLMYTSTFKTVTTDSTTSVEGGWLPATMHKAKQDPLDWLRGEVGRYVDLGRLDD